MSERKDVTPKEHKRNPLITGILGGVIGGTLLFGALYFGTGMHNSSSQVTSVENPGSNKVSTIKYDVQSDVTKAVDQVKEAVVSVVNLQRQKQYNNPLEGLFGERNRQRSDEDEGELETVSEGSGVIYRKDGNKAYIVTNNHVVDGQEGLEVLLSDGTKVSGKLIGSDAYTDLAVIEIPSEHVKKVAAFGDSDKIKVGEPAIAIGSPLGSQYANSVTQGIISSINRDINSTNEEGEPVNINAIQTDAAINPGNSGGPLINAAGQIIGINSIKIVQANSGVSAEGLGFAIPSNDVVNIINQLEKNGKVARPVLGIRSTELSNISNEQKTQILHLPSNVMNGVVVVNVENATPAEKAGLKQYDVIVKADNKDIGEYNDLTKLLRSKKVGDTIRLEIYRGKEKKQVEVELNLESNALNQSKNR